MQLTPAQLDLIRRPTGTRTFLEGPAGSGKTSTAAARLLALLEFGVPGAQVVLLVPQRALAGPYYEALRAPSAAAGGQVSILTAGGLARRMVDLFWPLVAREAGFAHPERPPAFLTLETAQYYMAHLVRPLLDEGLFESVNLDRNRLYSQVLDNLNKAALTGFPHEQIGERLSVAWSGESSQLRVFADAQRCAGLFRAYCLEHNLLDFSLQVELFRDRLRPSLLCREFLHAAARHVIADNIEEDTPFAHDLLQEWLPGLDSALLIYDQGAGYRSYLGADRASAQQLAAFCDERIVFEQSFTAHPALEEFGQRLGVALERPEAQPRGEPPWNEALTFSPPEVRFYPQMLDWVAAEVQALLEAGTPPGEIAILAPFLPDALRFALANRLDARGIPYRSHRPSRSLADEPAARCLLTLARLAHPVWELRPGRIEVVHALLTAIQGLDLVRAQLLAEIVYRPRDMRLSSFQNIDPERQERITHLVGERYEALREWLSNYKNEPVAELDFFFTRLFGEVLSQPGFNFHSDLDAGQVSANLIESAQKFRWAVESAGGMGEKPLGREYLEMVQDGVIASTYVQNWQPSSSDAVFIAPAYTFLLNNRPVDHQFWLDVGSNAWFERLYQPLTQPYVLSRAWPAGRLWTSVEEFEINRDTLFRLALGLLRRTRVQVHLAYSQLSEGGYDQRGMLLRSIYQIQLSGGRNG
jgi:superfamily I DNA/RNA helicase